MRRRIILCLLALVSLPAFAIAQQSPAGKKGGSPNIHTLSHLELGQFMTVGGIEVEQELSRPYAYVDRWRDQVGFDVIDLHNPAAPKVIYEWRLENPEKHALSRGETGKYFKTHGRYYYIKATEFAEGTLDSDIGAIVFDVTGLPDASKVKEVGRIRSKDFIDGFVNVFPYKHSDGRVLVFAAVRTWPHGMPPHANIYDMDKFLAGDAAQGLVGTVPIPEPGPGRVNRGYHDVHVAYDVRSAQDRFYGAGSGGFFIFDVTRPEQPSLITAITAIGGVPAQRAHTIIPTPDGRYVVTQMEYQFSPMMVFDLKPVFDGVEKRPDAPIGAWTADWRDLSHNHEVRWPYVFAAAYEDGLQVVDIRDPKNPKTTGWFYTCGCEHMTGYVDERQIHGPSVFSGAMELDVRNADGLIVLSDLNTGFWAFRMDGFKRWKGSDWNMPNSSSVQDWDNGPRGAVTSMR